MAWFLTKLPMLLHLVSLALAAWSAKNWGTMQSATTAPDIGTLGYYAGLPALFSALSAGAGVFTKAKVSPSATAPSTASFHVGEIAKIWGATGEVEGLAALSPVSTIALRAKPIVSAKPKTLDEIVREAEALKGAK